MKPCKKCGRPKTGTQAYCIECWRGYNRDKMSARRRHGKAFAMAQYQVSLILGLAPENQLNHLGELQAYYNDFPELRPEDQQ